MLPLSIITPTTGRPQAFALLERWYLSQESLPQHEWLVCGEDLEGYEFGCEQRVIPRQARDGEGHSLCHNLAAALAAAQGETIMILEDDDYYASGYSAAVLSLLDDPNVDLAGLAPAFYFHLPSRRWVCMGNTAHASLCQTAFRRSLIPAVLQLCALGKPSIDLALWKLPGFQRKFGDTRAPVGLLHVGIKGMLGTAGIGVGHRAELKHADPDLKWLRAQIGEAAEVYGRVYG